jgi:hypothetical protein
MSSIEVTRNLFFKGALGALFSLPVIPLGIKYIGEARAEEGIENGGNLASPTATSTIATPEPMATATSTSTLTPELPTPTTEATPVPTETLVPTPTATLEPSAYFDLNRIETGVELLDAFSLRGLRGKVVYIVYGRPNKYGEPTWGSLGATRTAEESWDYYRRLRSTISGEIGRPQEDFALNIINPVYRSVNGTIKDIYIDKALELAPQNKGLVALNFNNTDDAYNTIARLETIFPKERLAYLAAGLDVEHFPGHMVEARTINEFTAWFAQKHQSWAEGRPVPGVVLVYTFNGQQTGRIYNLENLVEYYPHQGTLVPLIFDGYGTVSGKEAVMSQISGLLPNSQDFPAILGAMEFWTRFGDEYDKCTIAETFSTLSGAQTFFFATQ